MEDTKKRSVAKTVSWRIVGTMDTVLISWILVGKVHVAVTIGIVELISKTLLYYFHERIWSKVLWGKRLR